MRKAIVIIAVVAMLGLISVFDSKHQNTASAGMSSNPISSQTASTSPVSSTGTVVSSTTYKDGTFTGSAEYNPYGTVQIAAVISGGKITDIKFIQMPSDQRESMRRTMYSEPYLKDSAISKQSANIDFVSGATDTSQGFEQSLQAALNQALNS